MPPWCLSQGLSFPLSSPGRDFRNDTDLTAVYWVFKLRLVMRKGSQLPKASFVSVKGRVGLHFRWRKVNAKKIKALWSCCVGYLTLISLFDIRFSFHISTDEAQQFLYKLHTSLFLSLSLFILESRQKTLILRQPQTSAFKFLLECNSLYNLKLLLSNNAAGFFNVSFSISSNTWNPELLSRWNLFWTIRLYQSDHHRLWRESKLTFSLINLGFS